MQYRSNSNPNRSGGPPAWFVFLGGMALALGLYYLFVGGQTFIRTGGLGVEASTEQAILVATATAEEEIRLSTPTWTPRATWTPSPECQSFIVIVESAIVRRLPNVNSPMASVVNAGEGVCVIERVQGTEWYLIDSRPETRRIDEAYMREDLISALEPTATTTYTFTPPPTITPITPTQTLTPDPNATATPSVTPIPLVIIVTATFIPTDTPTELPPTITLTPTLDNG